MSIVETFHGFIETTQDTLLIFEACRRGLLPRICRRLQEKERRIVQSGTVFVFDERESGIKRWTDGLVWSPSRILGNFLVYRELDKRNAGKKDASPIDRASRSSSSDNESALEKNKERALVGSLTNSYRFKKNGLIKKTMSIIVNGVSQHMISYYSKDDVLAGKLRTPSSVPELAGLEISAEFLMKQNFRIPPTVEQSYDSVGHSPRTPNGTFHSMNANDNNNGNNNNNNNGNGNNTDFSPTGFQHHVRPKMEPDLVSSSALDVFSKSYHQTQTHSQIHTAQGYHQVPHLATGTHHQQSHPYSPQHATFPSSWPVSAAQDQTPTSAPLRYQARTPNQFMPYPGHDLQGQTSQAQHQQQQQQQQYQSPQRNSLPPNQYGAGSPAMMMPSPGASSGNGAHDYLSMSYSTTHSQQNQQQPHPSQHPHHSSLPSTSQGWGDFSYPSYSNPSALASISDLAQHGQQHNSESP
ncbi:hypothetical protein BGZ94_010395 [Podila epigama]|nr:hypothetical protein BGZ94_010395 [Podila epigama]